MEADAPASEAFVDPLGLFRQLPFEFVHGFVTVPIRKTGEVTAEFKFLRLLGFQGEIGGLFVDEDRLVVRSVADAALD